MSHLVWTCMMELHSLAIQGRATAEYTVPKFKSISLPKATRSVYEHVLSLLARIGTTKYFLELVPSFTLRRPVQMLAPLIYRLLIISAVCKKADNVVRTTVVH